MNMAKTTTLIADSEIEWTELGHGLRRKLMAHNDEMMLTKVDFQTGALGTLHQHPHTQASYVSKGKFEITISGISKILSAGDVYFVPSGELHGALCLEAGELIDVFSPMRADFL
jgi:quercetin dioxygenase-like cupin family protein